MNSRFRPKADDEHSSRIYRKADISRRLTPSRLQLALDSRRLRRVWLSFECFTGLKNGQVERGQVWIKVEDSEGMIRKAEEGDIPRIKEIRNNVRENKLRDPSRVKDEDLIWFIRNPGIFVYEHQGKIVGFSAADTRDRSIFALFLDED